MSPCDSKPIHNTGPNNVGTQAQNAGKNGVYGNCRRVYFEIMFKEDLSTDKGSGLPAKSILGKPRSPIAKSSVKAYQEANRRL